MTAQEESSGVRCELCPHHCRIADGGVGLCAARGNRGGKIVCMNYGKLTSIALEPIEKKPLYHFHPHTPILSVGSYGCNLLCPFCQNYEISRAKDGDLRMEVLSPEALAQLAADAHAQYGNIGVAFTYNEPLVSYEYVLDCAKLLRVQHLSVVLETTKNAIQMAVASGVHVEVTTLVIPGKNDNEKEMDAEARWLASISKNIPIHLSRYFPRYHCDIPMTPVATLQRLEQIAKAHLTYVHLGNV